MGDRLWHKTRLCHRSAGGNMAESQEKGDIAAFYDRTIEGE